jgi:hypothetical protein
MMKILIAFLFTLWTLAGATLSVCSAPYNATGNGTTDDTAAVQSAITAAVSGDVVFWAPGCMTGIQGTSLSKSNASNITFRGSGKGSGIKAIGASSLSNSMGNGSAHFRLVNMTDSTVEYMEMDMNGIGKGTLTCDTCTRALVRHNEFHNSCECDNNGSILSFANGVDNVFLNNYVHHARGLRFTAQSRGVWVGNAGIEEHGFKALGNSFNETWMTGMPFHTEDGSMLSGTTCDNIALNSGGTCFKMVSVGGSFTTAYAFNTIARESHNAIQLDSDRPILVRGIHVSSLIGANANAIYASDHVVPDLDVENVTCLNIDQGCLGLYLVTNVRLKNVKAYGAGLMDTAVLVNGPAGGTVTLTMDRMYLTGTQYAGVLVDSYGGTMSPISMSNSSMSNNSDWGFYLRQNSGTIASPTFTNMCWSGNLDGNLFDSRGILSSPADNGPCFPNQTTPQGGIMAGAL